MKISGGFALGRSGNCVKHSAWFEKMCLLSSGIKLAFEGLFSKGAQMERPNGRKQIAFRDVKAPLHMTA